MLNIQRFLNHLLTQEFEPNLLWWPWYEAENSEVVIGFRGRACDYHVVLSDHLPWYRRLTPSAIHSLMKKNKFFSTCAYASESLMHGCVMLGKQPCGQPLSGSCGGLGRIGEKRDSGSLPPGVFCMSVNLPFCCFYTHWRCTFSCNHTEHSRRAYCVLRSSKGHWQYKTNQMRTYRIRKRQILWT